jgi:hypothetical protein
MNRIIISLCIGLGFLCYTVNAQKVTLEGKVSDSINNPLELANVIALNKSSGAMASYGITDEQGRYKLNLDKDSLYVLRASYLGFKTWEATFKASNDTKKDIILKASENQLDGVTVVEDFPVTISGDTITYNTDSFTTGKEKKLEDVLEELPGFEIDDEGQIKVQGKDISKVLVEGKNFFDGDTKMATKNIPANAVDKVQVLRDFNEIGPLSSVNDSDALALNIKLKDGKKNLWFGDISTGVGFEGRYLAHPNIFYYSPKFNVNFIGDLNNIGEQAFTLQDYFRFNGGLSSLTKRSGSSLNLSNDQVGLSLLQNNRAQNIDSKLAALNFNYNPNKKISFSGFGIVIGVDTKLSSISQRTYIRQEGDNNEILTSDIEQKNTSGLLKLSTTYTPNAKWHVNYDAFVKNSDVSDNNLLNSNFATFSNTINSARTREPFSIQQVLNAFYANNDKNIFSLESNYLYKRQRPNYGLLTEQAPFAGSLSLNGESPFDLFQDKEIFTNTFDLEFNYYRVLNETNHISFKSGLSLNNQSLNSELTELVDNNRETVGAVEEYVNDTEFNFQDIYFGIGYRVKFGKLTVSPGLNLHNYRIDNIQQNEITELDKMLLLPNLNSRYAFNSTQSLQFRYAIEAQFPDIQNLVAARELRGYNSLFTGNRDLKNEWYHNASLNYSNFSMFNFTTIYGGLTYQKRYESIGNAVNFIGLDRISSPINLDTPNENFSLFATFEKRFPLWKTKLESRLSLNKFNTVIDNTANFNQSFNQTYKLAFETRFREAPNAEVGFKKQLNKYSSLDITNTFITNSPYANIEAFFLKGFAITADYEYNDYKNRDGGVKSTYDFFNAALYYQKEDSKWEFKISGMNLLNTTTIRQDSFSNNLISTLEYAVQPRYFLARIKYEL